MNETKNVTNPGLNLHQRLVEIRKAATYLQKNAQGMGFKYVKEGDILSALREKMDEFRVLLHVDTISLVEVQCSWLSREKGLVQCPGIRVEYVFSWVNADDPQDQISLRKIVQASESDIDVCGSLDTYANRYFLLKYFNIPTDEADPDTFEKRKKKEEGKKAMQQPDQEAARQVISTAQKEAIEEFVGTDEALVERILKGYKVKNLAELQTKDFAAVLNGVKKIKGATV